MGRRPKPKSDDFFERTPSVIEVIAILCLKPLNNCSTVWEHYPDAGCGRRGHSGAVHAAAAAGTRSGHCSRRRGRRRRHSPTSTTHHFRLQRGRTPERRLRHAAELCHGPRAMRQAAMRRLR